MKVGQFAGETDAGRKRLRNEDAFVCRPPLFVVADGMGGAQAGELAARIATGVFEQSQDSPAIDGATRLRAMAHEANRQIYARSQTDPAYAGMGTTVTAALVEEERVALVHVGDSRAYRLRDGEISQLTDDHSLVAELVRSGRLTPEEAELHPQRAVITRALGTDPAVTADVFSVEARPGDIFLLCSDGLTTMLGDRAIATTVSKSSSASDAAAGLVKAANRSGGEDNVTALLFDVVDDSWTESQAPAAPSAQSDEDTLTELDGLPLLEETLSEPPRPYVPPPPAEGRRRRGGERGSSRLALAVAIVLALSALVIGAAVWGVRQAYFVGADENGRVVLYQGLPWDISGDVRLYRAVYISPVSAYQLSAEERQELFDHSLVSRPDGRERIEVFEREIQLP
ncbi:MAG: Stp1/IreP family PP2C-type Ser/Thr phosphatase [Gaiellales bacterium]